MPGYDGTGPAGAGPMSGWGQGYCRSGGAGNARGGPGQGFGRGRRCRATGSGFGAGRGGWRQNAAPEMLSADTANRSDEIAMLRNEAAQARQTLEAIGQRLASLEKAAMTDGKIE